MCIRTNQTNQNMKLYLSFDIFREKTFSFAHSFMGCRNPDLVEFGTGSRWFFCGGPQQIPPHSNGPSHNRQFLMSDRVHQSPSLFGPSRPPNTCVAISDSIHNHRPTALLHQLLSSALLHQPASLQRQILYTCTIDLVYPIPLCNAATAGIFLLI